MTAYPTYKLRSNWGPETEAPAELGVKFLDMLDRLGGLTPAANNWTLLDRVNYALVPLADVQSSMTQFVEHNVSRDDDGKAWPGEGYSLNARGSSVASEFGSAQTLDVSVGASSIVSNDMSLVIGDRSLPPDFSLITYPTYFGALKILASTWSCPWAEAYVFRSELMPEYLEPLVEPPAPPDHELQLPWLLYISPALSVGLTPSPDLVSERTPGGGWLLSAVEAVLDPANPDHRRRSALLQAIIDDRLEVKGLPAHLGAVRPARIGPY